MNTISPERTQYPMSGVTRPCVSAKMLPPRPHSAADSV